MLLVQLFVHSMKIHSYELYFFYVISLYFIYLNTPTPMYSNLPILSEESRTLKIRLCFFSVFLRYVYY